MRSLFSYPFQLDLRSPNSKQCCYPQSVWEAESFPNLQDSSPFVPTRISFVVSNLCRIWYNPAHQFLNYFLCVWSPEANCIYGRDDNGRGKVPFSKCCKNQYLYWWLIKTLGANRYRMRTIYVHVSISLYFHLNSTGGSSFPFWNPVPMTHMSSKLAS